MFFLFQLTPLSILSAEVIFFRKNTNTPEHQLITAECCILFLNQCQINDICNSIYILYFSKDTPYGTLLIILRYVY